VRIVVESAVTSNGPRWLDTTNNSFATSNPDVVSVEVLAPALPTAPGSVIRSKVSGAYRIRREFGAWVAGFGTALVEDVDLDASEWDVIFDAGDPKGSTR
jgi:hypothetical protein